MTRFHWVLSCNRVNDDKLLCNMIELLLRKMDVRINGSLEPDVRVDHCARNKVYNLQWIEKHVAKAAANIEKQCLEHEAKLARKAENICKAEQEKVEVQKRMRFIASGYCKTRSSDRVSIINHLSPPVAHLSGGGELEHVFALFSSLTWQVLPPELGIGPTPRCPLASIRHLPSTSSSVSIRHDDKRHRHCS